MVGVGLFENKLDLVVHIAHGDVFYQFNTARRQLNGHGMEAEVLAAETQPGGPPTGRYRLRRNGVEFRLVAAENHLGDGIFCSVREIEPERHLNRIRVRRRILVRDRQARLVLYPVYHNVDGLMCERRLCQRLKGPVDRIDRRGVVLFRDNFAVDQFLVNIDRDTVESHFNAGVQPAHEYGTRTAEGLPLGGRFGHEYYKFTILAGIKRVGCGDHSGRRQFLFLLFFAFLSILLILVFGCSRYHHSERAQAGVSRIRVDPWIVVEGYGFHAPDVVSGHNRRIQIDRPKHLGHPHHLLLDHGIVHKKGMAGGLRNLHFNQRQKVFHAQFGGGSRSEGCPRKLRAGQSLRGELHAGCGVDKLRGLVTGYLHRHADLLRGGNRLALKVEQRNTEGIEARGQHTGLCDLLLKSARKIEGIVGYDLVGQENLRTKFQPARGYLVLPCFYHRTTISQHPHTDAVFQALEARAGICYGHNGQFRTVNPVGNAGVGVRIHAQCY